MRRLILPALLCLAGSACGADFLWVETVSPPTTTTSSTTTTTRATTTSSRPATTTTTAPTTTTTTGPPEATAAPVTVLEAAPTAAPPPPQAFPAPLTGLPMDPARAGRPVLVVKVDNAPKARPQIGLNQADVIFEEGVEGGITRLAVLFHSKDSDPVGPVRSARSTDIALVTPLNHPLFAYSGANDVFKEYVARAPVVDVGYDAHPDRYHREESRPSPNNLFSTSPALFDLAPEGSRAPPALFPYRAPGEAAGGSGSRPASQAQVWWRGPVRETMAIWDWDATAQGWRRTQNAEPHTDGAGQVVTPPNVVIQHVTYKDTGFVDSTGSPVPEAQVVGEGEGVVLTGGLAIPVHWSKPSESEVTRYVDAAGAEVRLTPGQTWVELVPPGQSQIS
jgi:DUF3048 family protein